MTYTCICICECTHKKTCFMYLGNNKIYCIFKTFCIICDLFSTKCRLFHNFIFFCSNNTIFINHVLKLKYQPGYLRLKVFWHIISCHWYTAINILEKTAVSIFRVWAVYSLLGLWRQQLLQNLSTKLPVSVTAFSLLHYKKSYSLNLIFVE
jgi:hypothetical protein